MQKKTLPYLIGLCLITIGLLIYSCSKRFEDPSSLDLANGTVEVPDNLLQAAEDWHRQQTGVSASNIMVLSNGKKSYVLQPKWDNAKLQRKLNGKSSIVVPSPEYALSARSEVGVVRKFIFESENDKIIEGKIIELYADSAYMTSHKRNLVEKYNEKDMADFTGAAITYDVNYKYIKSEVYKNGVLQDKTKAEVLKGTNKPRDGKTTLGTPIKTLDLTCYDIYLLTWYAGYENGYYSVGYNEQYLYTYCYGDNNEYGGGGGGSGGGGDPGGGGGGGTGCNSVGKDGKRVNCDVPAPVPNIINNVVNPCLKNMVNSVIGANIQTKVNSMIQTVFGNNPNVHLYFTDQAAINNPLRDAETSTGYTNGYYFAQIALRTSTLSTSSKEFIAATIMHEALHAYMGQQNLNIDQHEEMANKYLNTMAAELQNMFSGLTSDAAYALAWGGLEGTYWYSHPDQLHQVPPYQVGLNALFRQHTYNGNTYGHGC